MLTTADRQRITRVLSDMKPEARLAHIARLRAMPGKAAEVSVLEGIHQQLTFAERAAATPLEVNGHVGHAASVPEQRRIEYPPYWTAERTKYAAYAITGISGILATAYYVIIPALMAFASAVISVVSVAAPYVAGGILAIFVLKESFFGEKKTGQFPAESQGRDRGNTYNVYVGEGQVHVHSANKNPGQ